MLKKRLFVVVTTVFLLFGIANSTSAAEAPQEMVNAVESTKSEALYDYKEGSMKLADFQEITVDDPELETSTIQMALAEYKTVRDNIFNINHKEVVYYDPENDQVLQETQVATVDEALNYSDSYKDITGSKVQMGMIILLILVVPLVFMGAIVLIWEPRQYSTTKFKIENQLFNKMQDSYR